MPSETKILVRSVNWLGDAIMSTPALQRLREAKPHAQMVLLTPEKLGGLWQNHPSIDKVITFTKQETVFSIGARLRVEHFDSALILPNSPRSALEAFLGHIPQRIGYSRPWRNCFLTQKLTPTGAIPMRKRKAREIRKLVNAPAQPFFIPSTAHHIQQYLRLAGALGANPEPLPPHIAVTAEEVERIRQRFAARNDPSRKLLLGLNAGAEYGPAKRWPRDNFVAAARQVQQKTGCDWWIFGNSAEQEFAASIATELQSSGPGVSASVQCLAGKTSLRELCAALKVCDLLLTNDSGPMHLAAAVGTPVIAVFGSTSPELTGPGLPGEPKHHLLKASVPCSPCFLRECPIDFRCMRNLTVDEVVAAVRHGLGR